MDNQMQIINTFYKNSKPNYKDIDIKKILILKEKAKKLNKLFNSEQFKRTKEYRYIKIMEIIYTNYRENKPFVSEFATTTVAEKFFLYMFSLDPELKAAIYHASSNTKKEIEKLMMNEFGVYDPNLVKIERIYIKYFLGSKRKEEIEEEINRRIYNL